MYLSKLIIENFRGIKNLELDFDPTINIIIGENGSNKSAVIDALRILYNIGEPLRSIAVSREDFYQEIINEKNVISVVRSTIISLTYIFKGLSSAQKGAFYEYIVLVPDSPDDDFAKIVITYEDQLDRNPRFSFATGETEGQRADYRTFELFKHYYLGALRDSTRDLLSQKSNILGKVIKRHLIRKQSHNEVENIMKRANSELLAREEVTKTRDGVNNNLTQIFKKYPDNKIGLQIADSKAENIVKIIKPFLPHDRNTLADDGFQLWQNSLGLNNLIYIATVLGDISEQVRDDSISHYVVLIEEPEAHLHPQLQLSLYNFLREASSSENSQLFITSHSPTLTSKVPLENLLLLDKKAYQLSQLFAGREGEKIIEDTVKGRIASNLDFEVRKKQIERYIDVTKSQLFFAKAVLFVEGISEELLIEAFAQVEGYSLQDYRIELVNVGGTSFYPFIHLFNSMNEKKRIIKPITIITDDDRFTSSKDTEYAFDRLVDNSFEKVDELFKKIQLAPVSNRVNNLISAANNAQGILIKAAFKTFEYELMLANVPPVAADFNANFLVKYLKSISRDDVSKIQDYIGGFTNSALSETERRKIALLMWKCLPSKSEFAQDFSIHILKNLAEAKSGLNIPAYISVGLSHLK